MKWFRRRHKNGTTVDDYIPRHLLTVRTDSSKSVEVYFIKKVSLQDSGTYRCYITEKKGERWTAVKVLLVRSKYIVVFTRNNMDAEPLALLTNQLYLANMKYFVVVIAT